MIGYVYEIHVYTVQNVFTGTQYYETFDMVRKNSDGEQRVIGRTDNSIRIKGVDWMPNEVAEQVVYSLIIL